MSTLTRTLETSCVVFNEHESTKEKKNNDKKILKKKQNAKFNVYSSYHEILIDKNGPKIIATEECREKLGIIINI